MPFSLILKKHSYSLEQLLQPGFVPESTSALEAAVLEFVQQWLGGQQRFVVNTSGSTGTPKPILISRAHMQASARLTLQALAIETGMPALLCIHPQYIGGKMMLVRAMEGGLPLMVVEPAANPLSSLSENGAVALQPLFTALVPLQLQAILQDVNSLAILNQMKAVIIGGAAVSAVLEEEVQQVTAPLYSTYGMTETVSHIALRRINGAKRQNFFNVLPQIRIGTDARGCLVIKGPVTEAAIVTNDVVEILGPGQFRWLGRADNTINSGGVKVQAEKVEEAATNFLKSLGLEIRALAGGLPDKILGTKVALLLEGNPLKQEQSQQLLDCLKTSLPLYWAPKDIFYTAKFVESDNGKIKRKESWAEVVV